MKIKILIFFIIGLILLNIAWIMASEIKFEILENGDVKFQSSSSDMKDIGRAISFSMFPNSRATGEDLTAINNLFPGTSDALGLNEGTTGSKLADIKKAIFNSIYTNTNFQFKSSLNSIENIVKYAKTNFRGGFIEINDKEIILRKSDRSEYVRFSGGYSFDYNEKDRAGFTLKADKYSAPKDFANVGGGLGYKLKLEKGAEFKFNLDSYGNIKGELKGKADISITSSNLKNIRDAVINLNNKWVIDYAQFTANEKNDYEFSYERTKYKFNVEKDGKITFDPKSGEIKGEKASLVLGDDVKEFKRQVSIGAKEWNILFEDNKIKNVNLKGYEKDFTINNVAITSTGEETNIFFDGKEHDGSYVSFGEKNLISKTIDEKSIQLYFYPDNSYLKIEKNDYTSFVINKNSELIIENRDNLGLIPKVIAKEDFRIYNDQKLVYTKGEDVIIKRTDWNGVLVSKNGGEIIASKSGFFSNSPIELSLLKGDGTSYLGNFKYDEKFVGFEEKPLIGNKIFFDNSYRFAVAPEEAEKIVATYVGIDSEFSARIKYNYPTKENIQILTGTSIKFPENIPEGNKEAVLVLLRDYYQSGISEALQYSIKKISFYDKKDYPDRGGFFIPGTSDIYFAWENFNERIFSHESTHSLHDKIRNSGGYLAFQEIPFKFENPLDDNWIDGQTKVTKRGELYVYEKELSKEESEKSPFALFETPKYGYVRPYGALNRLENVATYVEKANDPEFWNPLLSKDNPWRDIYWNNLNVLHNNRFITDQQFGNILKSSGIKLFGGQPYYE